MPENVAAAPQQGPGGPAFRQRAMERLARERGEAPAAPQGANPPPPPKDAAPANGAPDLFAESAENLEYDRSQGLEVEEDDDQYDLEGSAEDIDDAPLAEEQEDDGVDHDWEKRYKDLQRETQNILGRREEMETEHAENMAKHLELRFEMEDSLNEAVERAQYMRNVMSGNAQQFQNINWSQVPADQVAALQQQAQQAFMMAQQSDAMYQQIAAQRNMQIEKVRTREAAVAKVRLQRTIPGWGKEVYSELRDFATTVGMPAQEFNDITNPVIIEALHAYKQIRTGASTVKKNRNTQRQTQTPRSRSTRRQPRDERGQFLSKQVVPNQRGSFAEKHKHRLAAERQGR